MVLWRISRHPDLSGTGGLRLPGRWHHAGNPIVYLASTPASALLEVCVHTSSNDIPPSYTLLKVLVPDDLSILRIEDGRLAQNWEESTGVTRDLGSQWLKGNASALLAVPIAIVPETTNFLLNPLHPEAARCMIVASRSYPLDSRIKA